MAPGPAQDRTRNSPGVTRPRARARAHRTHATARPRKSGAQTCPPPWQLPEQGRGLAGAGAGGPAAGARAERQQRRPGDFGEGARGGAWRAARVLAHARGAAAFGVAARSVRARSSRHFLSTHLPVRPRAASGLPPSPQTPQRVANKLQLAHDMEGIDTRNIIEDSPGRRPRRAAAAKVDFRLDGARVGAGGGVGAAGRRATPCRPFSCG